MESTMVDEKPDIKFLIKTEIKDEYDSLLHLPLTDDIKDEPSLIDLKEIKAETGVDILGPENEQKYEGYDSSLTGDVKVEAFALEHPEVALDDEKLTEKIVKGKLCPYCNLLINPKKIKVHIMGHTGERPYKCTLCESSFKEKYNLSVHIKTHTGERNIPCTLCDRTFIVPSALKAHMRTHSKEKPYICNICGKGFSHSANLKPHMTTHSEELPFMCQGCGKHFRTRKGLVQHTKVHHVNCKNESCEFCLKYYTKKDTKRTAQKQYEKLRECSVCLQVFKYYTTYKNHMRMHNNESFQCGFCNKSYVDRAAIRAHLRKHTGEMPFQCEVCGKRFTRRDSYKYHISTHSDVRKLFHCDICKQGFTHKSSVFKHKRQVHDMDKPFKCCFCPRSFQSQDFLDAHILRMHSNADPNEKTYIGCRICEKNCDLKGYKVHMKKHGIIIFKCRKCKCNIEGAEAFEIHKKSGCLITDNQETGMNYNSTVIGENMEDTKFFDNKEIGPNCDSAVTSENLEESNITDNQEKETKHDSMVISKNIEQCNNEVEDSTDDNDGEEEEIMEDEDTESVREIKEEDDYEEEEESGADPDDS